MTKSTGVGKGKGGGPKPKEQKAQRLGIIVNSDRMTAYKDYLTSLWDRPATDAEVAKWVRGWLNAELGTLDKYVDSRE